MDNNSSSTALLVMDMLEFIVNGLPESHDVIQNVKTCIQKAREKNIPVIYANLGFREGFPEISANNIVFTAFKERMANISTAEMAKIHPEVAPLPEETIVTKRRVSAFTGSDLEVVLRAKNINHLVLTGIATSGIVLSTLTEAFDKDFKLTVISDACKDRDEEVHKVLTTKVFPNRAHVVTAKEWNI